MLSCDSCEQKHLKEDMKEMELNGHIHELCPSCSEVLEEKITELKEKFLHSEVLTALRRLKATKTEEK